MTVFENEGQRQASAKVTSVGVKHVHTKARRYDRGLKPSVVISEFESQPKSRFPRRHLSRVHSRKSQFLQDNSRQITVFSRTSHKTEAPNHSFDHTFWRVGD